MTREVLIAHADGDEELAEKLADWISSKGYRVQCRAFTLVGESPIARENKSLQTRGPIVLCGTCRSVGSKSVANLIQAAQSTDAGREVRIFPVKLETDADIARLGLPGKVADCTVDFDSGMERLLKSLCEYFPLSAAAEAEKIPIQRSYLETEVLGENSDFEAIRRFRSDLRAEVKLEFPAELSADDFLEQAGVMRSGHLTRVGLLMFGIKPQAAIPQSICHFTVYEGADRSAEMEPQRIFGTIPNQLQKITDLIQNRIRKREYFDPVMGKVVPNYEYPMISLREIIANALAGC